MIKQSVKVITSKKEYPNLTFEQIKELAELRNKGMSEEEAMQLIINKDSE